MEKKVYMVYESSKGRKDLIYCTDDRENAIINARNWSRSLPRFSYRIYEVPLYTVVDMNRSKYNRCDYKPSLIEF